MNENNLNTFTKEIRPLFNQLKQALPEMKTILLIPIAYGYALVEKTIETNFAKQAIAKQEEETRKQKEKQEEEARKQKEKQENERLKIEEEIRAEQRELRLYKEQNKLTPRKVIHTSLAFSSTIALILGVSALFPIAKLSMEVNECHKELEKSNPNISSEEKAMICNNILGK